MTVTLWMAGLTVVSGAISALLGWFDGIMVIYLGMAISAFPLFHFAMHWPLKGAKTCEITENHED